MKLTKWFTLVELIVVITILAILGTIWFISLQWYSRDARNSARTTDISTIEKAISLHRTRWNPLPTPDNSSVVSYGWYALWSQWTYGAESMKKVWSLTTVPVDPASKNEYNFSVSNTWREYQVAWVFEWEFSYTPIWPNQAYAAEKTWKTFIKWNYNKRAISFNVWENIYVLAVPSITSSDHSLTDYYDLVILDKLLYHNQNGAPWAYSWSSFSNTSSFSFDPDELLIYEWTKEDLNLLSEQVEYLLNMQKAFSGTLVVADSKPLQNLMSITIDENTPSYDVKKTVFDFVTNDTWFSVNNHSESDYVISETTFWTCNLTQEDIDELIAFFSYSGSPYQHTSANAQSWCNLTTINATSKWITWVLPKAIGKLTNLQNLYLANNSIGWALPKSMKWLQNLKQLYLNGNDFEWFLPTVLWTLSSLEQLQIYSNNFSWAIPSSIGNLSNLERFVWFSNNFTNFPRNIDNMTNLTRIQLAWNPNFKWPIPDGLAALSNLEILQLAGTNLWDLSFNFSSGTAARTQENITVSESSMTIAWNGSTIDISVN